MIARVITLAGVQFDGEVDAVRVMTTSGEITVLNHHRPLITSLAPSRCVLTAADGANVAIPVSGGFLEVSAENTVTVLADART